MRHLIVTNALEKVAYTVTLDTTPWWDGPIQSDEPRLNFSTDGNPVTSYPIQGFLKGLPVMLTSGLLMNWCYPMRWLTPANVQEIYQWLQNIAKETP